MITSEKMLKEIFDGLKLQNEYVGQPEINRLVKEASDYYNYAGWCKPLFIDNQAHFLRYYVKLTVAREYAYKFYDLIVTQRKEQGLFVY
ncbi:hypothetical protein ABH307_00410 [Acinetobacter pittii]|uniref:hypothetical protein n=1 Tax=Acinetobacter pittii TaxID=48296 RepID=UPI003261A6F1